MPLAATEAPTEMQRHGNPGTIAAIAVALGLGVSSCAPRLRAHQHVQPGNAPGSGVRPGRDMRMPVIIGPDGFLCARSDPHYAFHLQLNEILVEQAKPGIALSRQAAHPGQRARGRQSRRVTRGRISDSLD